MTSEGDGWFTARTEAEAGETCAYRLSGGQTVPDPAARQPARDRHGPSLLAAPRVSAAWADWPWEEAVIYEVHVGAFSAAGTFRVEIAELDRLAALGITAIELMPLAQFRGDRGWGYDGVPPY